MSRKSPIRTTAPGTPHPDAPRSPAVRRDSWLYDDLLVWLSPGGLLLTALMLRFPEDCAPCVRWRPN